MDITKCSGVDCPIKDTCKRFTVQGNELWQSWFIVVPGFYATVAESGGPLADNRAEWKCEFFMKQE